MAPAVAENWAQGYYRRVHTYYESKYVSTLSSAAVAGVSSLSVGGLGTPPVGFRSVVGRPLSFFVGVSFATFMVFCIKIILQTAREQMKRRALMVEATEGLDVSLIDPALYAARQSEVSWPEDSGDGSTLQKAPVEPYPTPSSISFRSLSKPQQADTVQRTETTLNLKSQGNSHLGPSTMAVNLPKAYVPVIDASTDASARDSTSKDEGVKKHIHLKSEEYESPMKELSLQKQNPGEPMIVLLSVMSCLWDGMFQNQTARNSTVITDVWVESSRESAGKPLMYRAKHQRFIKPRGSGMSPRSANELSPQKYDAVGTIVHGLLEQSAIAPRKNPFDPFGHLLDAQFKPPCGVQPYDAFGNLVMSISQGADTLSSGTPLSALISSANENVTVINYPYCPVSQLLTHRHWLVTDWAGVGSHSSESKVPGKYDPVGLLIKELASSTSDGTTSRMSVLSRYDPIGQLLANRKSPPVYEELRSVKYDPISTLLKSFSRHSWDRHESNKYDPVGCILAEAREIKAPSLDDNNPAAWDPVWWLLRGRAGRWVAED